MKTETNTITATRITEQIKKEVAEAMSQKPPEWRKGQFVFNFIEQNFGVSSVVQFQRKIDCFYNDSKIDEFIEACAEELEKIYND